MQLAKFIVSILIAALVTIFSLEMIEYLIYTLKLDWFAAYLLPIAIVLGVTMLCCHIVWILLEKKLWAKILVVVAIATVMVLPYFILNPIYIQDIQKHGETVAPGQFSENATLQEILSSHPDFDGLLAIADADCDHCKKSMKNMLELVSRNDKLDLVVYLYTQKPERLNAFKEATNTQELEFHMSPDEDSLIKLCDGSFPSFFYIRNGQVVQKWYNDQFGYRALAWVDSGLNE